MIKHWTKLKQSPRPGQSLLAMQGDILTITLELPQENRGQAWVRTNLCRAKIKRREVIREVDRNQLSLELDWHDLPLTRVKKDTFVLQMGLHEVGHFEGKCYFIPQGSTDLFWPVGDNFTINVAPAISCAANTIYNAFVRQFGPNCNGQFHFEEQDVKNLEDKGFTVIPPSGTFHDLKNHLEFIFNTLGCRYLQLLPIHPTPTTYARMGPFGSPYASLSFTAVDPALAVFDPRATPLEQFIALVDAVHALEGKLILDIAVNHTGWAADLHEKHPEWLARDPEGRIEQPGAWGVTWADLTRLDYSHQDLWQYIAEVFLTWCKRGVDGFRCDAGYMIPQKAWTYIIARVREHFPETIFFLEGLGGPLPVTQDLLDRAGFNWAYSELFQNYNQQDIQTEIESCSQLSLSKGLMIHYAETHDNNRLAATSKAFARLRTGLCALSSSAGGFGFANGVEWFATEKISVHQAPSLNWGNPENQVQFISRLNKILSSHPAFFHPSLITCCPASPNQIFCLFRKNPTTGDKVLVVVNLDPGQAIQAQIKCPKDFLPSPALWELILQKEIRPETTDGKLSLNLDPGQVCCLAPQANDLQTVNLALPRAQITRQRLQAKAVEIKNFLYPEEHWLLTNQGARPVLAKRPLSKDHPLLKELIQDLQQDPLGFCQKQNPDSAEPRVITWDYPQDSRREVMIPPRHFLLIRCRHPFRADLCQGKKVIRREDSLPAFDQTHFALFLPLRCRQQQIKRILTMTVYTPEGNIHIQGHLLYLPHFRQIRVQKSFQGTKGRQKNLLAQMTNPLGAVTRAHAAWGHLASRYDGLLSVPPDPELLTGRQMLLARVRAWIVHQGYSQALELKCLQGFAFDFPGPISWKFHLPCGQGMIFPLLIKARLKQDDFVLQLTFAQDQAGKSISAPRSSPSLILRPDVEDRYFHETTKAYQGPEQIWPKNILPDDTGFFFHTSFGGLLDLHISKGHFVLEPEWQYMVKRPLEEERGLDPFSDLFSPGYFQVTLSPGQEVILQAKVSFHSKQELPSINIDKERISTPQASKIPLGLALEKALEQFLVNKARNKTIIAGYPWFLDWGRDSLIVCRGLLASGKIRTALDIMQGLARFEEQGTLPNMIQGQDISNRDTSDAPLWLFTACADLTGQDQGPALFSDWQSTLGQALLSIAKHYIQGTPNGIKMDQESGLIFSPAHFTWMDTNHPAGTPRQGYPIEIQALWFAALKFLAQFGPVEKRSSWAALAKQVQDSVQGLFVLPGGYLADCLLANPGQRAKDAEADHALRPNQLLAITLRLISEQQIKQDILLNCLELLVPGGIRSLADRPVYPALPIWFNGQLLNDPQHPYQGHYQGDEDRQRKPAYHNGTAWTWLLPSFCEAWVNCFGPQAKTTALSWLGASTSIINSGCLGQVPEIQDGDHPHQARGCDAQAWGCSELLRVWIKLLDL